jgi:hypothetical protein
MSAAENLGTELAQMEQRVEAAEAIAQDARRAFENFRQRWSTEEIESLQSIPHDERLKARLNGTDPIAESGGG